MARVLIIRQGFVPIDPRVWREAQALEHDGHEIDIISGRTKGMTGLERVGRITIYRLPMSKRRGGPMGYFVDYLLFLIMASCVATILHLKRGYDMVQVNSLPDTLVFAALVPRLMGARVLLDLQETTPEFFATKFRSSMQHPLVRVIAWFEQQSIRFADHVLTCTEQMRDAYVRRGAPGHKITVILNSSNEEIFNPDKFPPRPRTGSQFVVMCHGTIEERYGIDTVIRAVAQLKDEISELRFKIYGEGSFLPTLHDMVSRFDVADRVWFSDGLVPIDELVSAIADADVGVVAMKRDIFRDQTHCHKMFDYIAMKRPTLVSRTTSVMAYFDEDCFEMFTSGDVDDLARAIRRLHGNADRCSQLVQHMRTVGEPYRWARQREVYLNAVRELLVPTIAARAPAA